MNGKPNNKPPRMPVVPRVMAKYNNKHNPDAIITALLHKPVRPCLIHANTKPMIDATRSPSTKDISGRYAAAGTSPDSTPAIKANMNPMVKKAEATPPTILATTRQTTLYFKDVAE